MFLSITENRLDKNPSCVLLASNSMGFSARVITSTDSELSSVTLKKDFCSLEHNEGIVLMADYLYKQE